MRDDAVRRGAFRNRDIPLIRGGLHQHRPGGGAALAHILVRLADAAAAAGGEVAPGALALHALARRRVLDLHLGPVALELFGDELREAGDGALPHLGAHDADVDGVVGPDRDPDADLGRAILRARHGRTEGKTQPQNQATCDRSGADDK